jgi:hypothetical protein
VNDTNHGTDGTARGRQAADNVTAPSRAELPALTAPLVVTTPNAEHWILLGSLLEDLRRVREEILG